MLIYPSESVNEGVNVTITCTTYSNPPPEIILKKVYPYNKTILSSKNGTFTLYNVTRNDTGKYLVNVSNEAGTDIEVIEIAVIGRYIYCFELTFLPYVSLLCTTDNTAVPQ